MINGFEEITAPLNEYEQETLLPILVHGFKKKIGVLKAAKSKDICTALKSKGYKITDARLRKVIAHIRIHRLIKNLISTSKGYFIATDPDEVIKYKESLKQRIRAIEALEKSFH